MSRTRTVRFNLRLASAAAGLAMAALVALAPPAVANIAPEVSDGTVTPTSLPYTGGQVTVSAFVRDIEGGFVDFVYVEVTDPFGTGSGPALSNAGEEWFGFVEVPPNFSTEPVTYSYTVVARDSEGAEGRGFAGEVQVAGAPPFDEAPIVSDPSVVPRDLKSTGGPVKLAVSASDVGGIIDTYADVTRPGGTPTRVTLEAVSATRFEGVFTAPPNAGTGTVQYAVQMIAVDTAGQSASVDGGVIRVAGVPSGRLEVRTTAVDFGTTQVGKRMQRPVQIRNNGAKSTAPVQGVLTTSGAPFFITGAPATGLPFCLRGGESLTAHVEFRPTAAGLRRGALLITRPDLVQPTLSVPLAGTGITRNQPAPLLAPAGAKTACR